GLGRTVDMFIDPIELMQALKLRLCQCCANRQSGRVLRKNTLGERQRAEYAYPAKRSKRHVMLSSYFCAFRLRRTETRSGAATPFLRRAHPGSRVQARFTRQ